MPFPPITLEAPAKINLFLAITGRREDGYHELVSLLLPLRLADLLTLSPLRPGEPDRFTCSDPDLQSPDNLAWRALQGFRQRCPGLPPVALHLEKKVPCGAGLGGGSSDAATTLRALNQLSPSPLAQAELHLLALALGSDCPYFLNPVPAILRGRGEHLEPLSGVGLDRFPPILVLKPGFPISTGPAYGAVARLGHYDDPAWADRRLREFVQGRIDVSALAYNRFSPTVDERYLAIPALRSVMEEHGLGHLHLSGSGSACFLLGLDPNQCQQAIDLARECWGPGCFACPTEVRPEVPRPGSPA